MKVMNTIILAKPKEALLYIYSDPKHTENLISHLYSKSVTNLLVVIINTPKDLFNDTIPSNELYNFSKEIFTKRKEIFRKLIKLACKTSYFIESHEMHINICSILTDMIVRIDQLIDGKALFTKIFEEGDELEQIFEATIPSSYNNSSRQPTVLWNLMDAAINNAGGNTAATSNNTSTNVTAESNKDLLNLILTCIDNVQPKYANYLSSFLNDEIESKKTSVSTFGAESKILGKQPVKIGGVILSFLKTNHERFDMGLYKYKILHLFLEQMIKYPWNNIFHNYVTNILTHVLEGNYPNAKKSLYEDEFIQSFMLRAVENRTLNKSPSSDKKFTLGYLGHLKKIVTAIIGCQAEEIQIGVQESVKWNEFCERYFNEEHEIENRDLGGVRVRQDTNISNPEDQFYFSIEEIRSKYSDFLNPASEESNKSSALESEGQNNIENSINFEDNSLSIDPDLNEIMLHGKNSDDPNFNEGTFWKSDLYDSHNVDDLLKELM